MTRDDIIRMAREAGASQLENTPGFIDYLQSFAALVAAAERERIKAANAPEIQRVNEHIKELEQAVAAEREACARVCEDQASYERADFCAKLIRARGQE